MEVVWRCYEFALLLHHALVSDATKKRCEHLSKRHPHLRDTYYILPLVLLASSATSPECTTEDAQHC